MQIRSHEGIQMYTLVELRLVRFQIVESIQDRVSLCVGQPELAYAHPSFSIEMLRKSRCIVFEDTNSENTRDRYCRCVGVRMSATNSGTITVCHAALFAHTE